jgi:regulator of cell morphogenesis and NO signaling
MILTPSTVINENACAADIVKEYYRTATVFRKYGIEFCCGARWPLKMVLESHKLDQAQVMAELVAAARIVTIPANLPFDTWSMDFLADYIINIHHEYLRKSLPSIKDHVVHFVEEHRKKYPYLSEVERKVSYLDKTMIPHLLQEEDVIFPYIRQISHAYQSKESYATLLVRTLRKPVQELMEEEHDTMEKVLNQLRELTNHYTAPEGACTSHRLAYALLKELDDDLVQHMYLENEILFPKAIAMEKELLARP